METGEARTLVMIIIAYCLKRKEILKNNDRGPFNLPECPPQFFENNCYKKLKE